MQLATTRSRALQPRVHSAVHQRVSLSVVSDSLQCHGLWLTRLLCPWDSPGKNAGVGCHALLQGIFPTQELNPGLPYCRQILYSLSHRGVQLLPKSPSPSVLPIFLWGRESQSPFFHFPDETTSVQRWASKLSLLFPRAPCSFFFSGLHLLLIRIFLLIEYSSYIGTNYGKGGRHFPPPPPQAFPNEWKLPQTPALYCLFLSSSWRPQASSSDW